MEPVRWPPSRHVGWWSRGSSFVLILLTRIASQPSFALLYSGLEPAAAGQVVEAIAASGVPHRVEGNSIFVEASERDALRISLAGQGLPANGPQGYELLDSLSGFGTTSQMFDAAYWRAKEGELARTILASPTIRAARVHIANPSADPFQPQQEVTASIAIRPAAGGLAPGHAQALRYLVASSVPGLSPSNVTVVDADSGQIFGSQSELSSVANAATRAEQLQQNIERLLAARVGSGNAVVEVSVELETARELIVERVIDPDTRVIVESESEEMDTTSRDGSGSGVTVASNLPDGDAAGGDASSAQSAETRERIIYDMSELQRELERGPGDIRRLTVAVLLNGIEQIGPNGQAQIVPRPDTEIEALSELVRSAIGFDETRGDRVTIQSMAFDEDAVIALEEAGLIDRLNIDVGQIVQTALLATVALAIAFGLIRPLLTREQGEVLDAVVPIPPAPLPAPSAGTAEEFAADGLAMAVAPEFAGTEGEQSLPTASPELPALAPMGNAFDEALPMLMSGAMTTEDTQSLVDMDPIERLRHLITEREEETVQILQSWMEEDEEGTK